MKQILIIGKRWFDRVNGNTYHSVDVYIDSQHVHTSARHYGYGSAYEETAAAWLDANGHTSRLAYANGGCEALWQCANRQRFRMLSLVFDVPRKRDLGGQP